MVRNDRGFLLIETLLALSLLAIGAVAVTDAFSATRDTARRSDRDWALAVCAQNRILQELIGLDIKPGVCPDGIEWQVQRKLSPGPVESVSLTAQGETFETVRRPD